ncbi:MAG: hypothetical protein RL141_1073 [Candidatus Parcubacteria bacterium]
MVRKLTSCGRSVLVFVLLATLSLSGIPFEIPQAEAAITFQSSGAVVVSGITTIAPAYPASVAAGDLLVLMIGMKPSTANSGSVTTPEGWTAVSGGSLTGAGGYATTLGADTGNTNVFSYFKVAEGNETGSLLVRLTTNNVSWAQMHRVSNATQDWSVAGTTGSDITGNTAVSIGMSANPGVAANDLILAAMVIPTDITTPSQFSAEAFTQTGVTFGTVTEISEPDTTTGNQIGGFVVRVPVTAGTGSASPILSATAGGTVTNVRGPGVFIRIRATGTITFQSSGAVAIAGTTTGVSVCPPHPASVASGDLLVTIIGMKPSTANSGSVTTPSGWTAVSGGSLTGAGGYGTTLAVDTGNTNVFSFFRQATGSEVTERCFALSTNNVSWAQMHRLSKGAGTTWDVAATTGSDITGDTSVSIGMSANPGVAANDLILAAMVIPTAVTTPSQFSAEAFTQTGVTFGTVTEISEPDTTTGNDLGGFMVRVPVTAGTGSAAPTLTATAGGTVTNVRGPGLFIRIREVGAGATLTIGATAGSKVTVLNAGDTSQQANTTSCTSAANCAAFTLSLSSGSETVTSIKITETGTADANNNLANLALFYDTDGNFSNGTTGQFGSTVAAFTTEAATVSGSLVINSGTTYFFYVRFDLLKSGTSPKGGQTVNFQIAADSDVGTSGAPTKTGAPVSLAGTTTVLPNATGTTFGSGLADGGRSGESITVSGFGFGVAPVGSRGNCAGAVDTGCVRLTVGGNDTVATGDVSAWSNTSITYTIATGLASLGGASAVEVVSGSQADATKLNFFVYPRITGMAAIGTNAGREHAAGTDTDGLIMLQGDHFSSAGSVAFTGNFGSVAGTVHATAEGPCTTGGWSASGFSSNTVCVEISPSIADTVATGTVTLTRTTDTKTSLIDLNVLPRILSNTPTSGVAGDVVQISGNHFCQTGTCPTSPNRSSASNHVVFGSTQAADADFVNQTGGGGACNGSGAAWTQTEICVKVPAGTPAGSQPTEVTSNTEVSNTRSFTVASTAPNDPTGLKQFKSDGLTEMTPVGIGTNGTTIVLEGDVTAGTSITMKLDVEVKPIGTAFNGTATASSTSVTGTSVANVQVTVPGLTNGTEYHWRARTRNVNTSEVSNWVAFGANPAGNGSGDGSPANRDTYIDTSAPGISIGSPPSCTAHGSVTDTDATISWTVSGESISTASTTNQLRYGTDSTLVTGSTVSLNGGVSPSGNVTGLNPSTTYYYWVKSTDAVGNATQNPASSPFCSFTTQATVVRVMKTIDYFVTQQDQITSAGMVSSTFPLFIAETSPTIRDAYLELQGVMIGTGGGAPTVQVQVNGETPLSVNLANSTSPQPWTIRYHLPSLTLNCALPVEGNNGICADGVNANTLFLTLGGGFSKVSLLNAHLVLTYHYTP